MSNIQIINKAKVFTKKVPENEQNDLIGAESSTLPVVMIADLIAAGLQSG
jgi:hypothetical protein